MTEAETLFDASSCPGYAERRKRHLRAVTLILIQGMLVIPLAFLFVWVMLEVVVYTGIDPVLLGTIFLLIIVLQEIVMYYAVRPALTKGWKVPTRIKGEGVEHAGRSIRFKEVARLMRFDFYLVMEMVRVQKNVTLFHAQLGDVDEFVKVFRQQAPGVEFRDMRKQRSND
jgi:hypothetical protein